MTCAPKFLPMTSPPGSPRHVNHLAILNTPPIPGEIAVGTAVFSGAEDRSHGCCDLTVDAKTELEPWAEEMLAEQEEAQPAEPQPQQANPAASNVILFQVPSLSAGDAQGLADIILAHPELYRADPGHRRRLPR